MSKLKLLPLREYIGDKRYDPFFLYRYPIIGRLYRQRVELCLDELSGGKRILEIGFGSGLTFLNLSEQYQEIWGLDLTSDVEKITDQFREKQIETFLQNGNVLAMPYPDDFFDSVLLISILEHLHPQEQEIAFREIRRVLKPGGQAVYGVPVERPFMVFMFRILGYDIRDHHFTTEKDIAMAAARHFEKVKIKEMKATPSFFGKVYEIGHFIKR
jgi:ubiquinone/menaquinone biosynthesis C-methylase UbiE